LTTFDERENAYEAEFAHQEELSFKVRERTVALLALWAAEYLDKTAEASKAYAREIVAPDVANPTSDAAVERVVTDLRARGIGEQETHRARDRFLAQAHKAIRGSVP
jgi:hypothetical protein